MRENTQSITVLALISCCAFVAISARAGGKTGARGGNKPAVLWTEPADIESRDLFYGPGGTQHVPSGTFTFEKEDLDGTNPKFVVRDQNGVKWKVKLGEEARPETAASRLVWAAGYGADEDYFVANLQVLGMPLHPHRGADQVGPDGFMHIVRMKRYLKGEEKAGRWRWAENPFTGTRELSGLRVMMALMNNWDLKDENNKIYDYDSKRIYLVSDLGASFGTTGRSITRAESKGNLEAYRNSKFIDRVSADSVDFAEPSRPALIHLPEFPAFVSRVRMEWIGRNIPKADCKWIGGILARLSPDQILSAFRASGYTPDQAESFTKVVQGRIAELNAL